jgi:hypothetical protein
VRVTSATNALVVVGGVVVPLPGPLPVPAGSIQFTLAVWRATVGQAPHVNLEVVDGCGTWPTFVGGGPEAF